VVCCCQAASPYGPTRRDYPSSCTRERKHQRLFVIRIFFIALYFFLFLFLFIFLFLFFFFFFFFVVF
jgi:hypothetical protein